MIHARFTGARLIHFLCTGCHAYTLDNFLNNWAPALRSRLRAVPYASIDARRPVPAGPVIFSDLERLRPGEWPFVLGLESALRRRASRFPILNPPSAWTGRLGLHGALRRLGGQDFRVFRAARVPSGLRFPVFLRKEDDHRGPQSPLLESPSALQAALDLWRLPGGRLPDRLLVVEFLNCRGADGWVRKYSAYKIGPRLIPRHLHFSRHWVVKKADAVEPETLAEEQAFLAGFPHAGEVARAFQAAGLDYGRIDYAFHRGRMQVWEINTNPALVPRAEKTHPLRLDSEQRAAGALCQAFLDLDQDSLSSSGAWAGPWDAVRLNWSRRRLDAAPRP